MLRLVCVLLGLTLALILFVTIYIFTGSGDVCYCSPLTLLFNFIICSGFLTIYITNNLRYYGVNTKCVTKNFHNMLQKQTVALFSLYQRIMQQIRANVSVSLCERHHFGIILP